MSPISKIAAAACAVLSMTMLALPAQAQIFWSPPPLNQVPQTGMEPALQLNLPGATPQELNAAMTWHLRSALNVAALQCGFEPSLLSVDNYNSIISQHSDELASAFATLGGYFTRVYGKGKAAQTAFDQYNTRTYSSYAAVQTIKSFCSAAGRAATDAIFAPRGSIGQVARLRLLDIRQALGGAGEQQYANPAYYAPAPLPSLTKECWKGKKLRDECRRNWQQAAAQKR